MKPKIEDFDRVDIQYGPSLAKIHESLKGFGFAVDKVFTCRELKEMYVKRVYEALNGNVYRTARVLSISPHTVRRIIKL